jgi:hypothetical protein
MIILRFGVVQLLKSKCLCIIIQELVSVAILLSVVIMLVKSKFVGLRMIIVIKA